MIRKSKTLNEEVNRIQSLFGDDRLYGNIVNENKESIQEQISKRIWRALDDATAARVTKALGADAGLLKGFSETPPPKNFDDIVNHLTKYRKIWDQIHTGNMDNVIKYIKLMDNDPIKYSPFNIGGSGEPYFKYFTRKGNLRENVLEIYRLKVGDESYFKQLEDWQKSVEAPKKVEPTTPKPDVPKTDVTAASKRKDLNDILSQVEALGEQGKVGSFKAKVGDVEVDVSFIPGKSKEEGAKNIIEGVQKNNPFFKKLFNRNPNLKLSIMEKLKYQWISRWWLNPTPSGIKKELTNIKGYDAIGPRSVNQRAVLRYTLNYFTLSWLCGQYYKSQEKDIPFICNPVEVGEALWGAGVFIYDGFMNYLDDNFCDALKDKGVDCAEFKKKIKDDIKSLKDDFKNYNCDLVDVNDEEGSKNRIREFVVGKYKEVTKNTLSEYQITDNEFVETTFSNVVMSDEVKKTVDTIYDGCLIKKGNQYDEDNYSEGGDEYEIDFESVDDESEEETPNDEGGQDTPNDGGGGQGVDDIFGD
jgi:hypothetical protein